MLSSHLCLLNTAPFMLHTQRGCLNSRLGSLVCKTPVLDSTARGAFQIFISHPYELHCNLSLSLLHLDFADSLIRSGFQPKIFHAFPISQFMAHIPPKLISWTWSCYYHLLHSLRYEAPDHVIFFILPHFRIFCRSKKHFLYLGSINLSSYVIYLVSWYVRHTKFVKK